MKPIILSILTSVLALPVYAATFTYDFTATRVGVTFSHPAATIADTANGFGTLTGTLVLDDTLLTSATNSATYAAPVLTIDQFALGSAMSFNSLSVDNDLVGRLDQIGGVSPEFPDDGQYHDRVSFFFQDRTRSALSSAAFPSVIDVADYGTARLLFYSGGKGLGARDRVDFDFTELTLRTPAAVPLPAGLPLLLGGMGVLALARRRKNS